MHYQTDVVFTLTYTIKKIYSRFSNGAYPVDVKVVSFEGYPKKTGFPKEYHGLGYFPVIHVGDTYKSKTRFHMDPRNGYSFNFIGMPEEVLPSTEKEVAKYFEKHISGLGKVGSRKIVEALGCSAITIIANNPKCLERVDGLKKKQKTAIAEWCVENINCEDVILYLYQNEIPLEMARSIYDRYGDLTIAKLNENPYAIYESGNIPFRYAEKMASNVGLKWDDPNRLLCAVRAAIDDRIDSKGDTCVLNTNVIAIAENYIARSRFYDAETCRRSSDMIFSKEEYDSAIQKLIKDGELIEYQRSVSNGGNLYYYRKQTYSDEMNAAEAVVSMVHRKPAISTSPTQIKRFLESRNSSLAEEQIDAVVMAATHGFSVLTGGPGTGKTYTMKAVVEVLKAFKPEIKIVQAAPTAKAASRMREITGLDSDTIHSIFKIGYGNTAIEQEFTLKADYIIIDEASMIGSSLFTSMLNRMLEKACILVVGDPAQLPSVDCGDVLNSLCISKVVPVSELKTIHRQAKESGIVTNAHKIRSKDFEKIKDISFNIYNDFKGVYAKNEEMAADLIVDKVQELRNRRVLLEDILVLTPVHATACGTDMLNERLQAIINPHKEGEPEYIVDDTKAYHIGDRVMNTQNFKIIDSDGKNKKVKNGEVGYIINIDAATIEVQFDNSDEPVQFTKGKIDYLDLAYAMTIHKSQGSEADYVIMPCVSSWKHQRMLTNQLIYTALTRAKKGFICVGTRENFINGCIPKNQSLQDKRNAIKSNTSDARTSLFSLFLRNTEFSYADTPND